jgi:hypothetical protein
MFKKVTYKKRSFFIVFVIITLAILMNLFRNELVLFYFYVANGKEVVMGNAKFEISNNTILIGREHEHAATIALNLSSSEFVSVIFSDENVLEVYKTRYAAGRQYLTIGDCEFSVKLSKDQRSISGDLAWYNNSLKLFYVYVGKPITTLDSDLNQLCNLLSSEMRKLNE